MSVTRCRCASYRTSAAATAALSDSTGGSIGIVTRSSAVLEQVAGQSGAFAADRERQWRRAGPRRRADPAAARHRRDDSAAVCARVRIASSPRRLTITGRRRALPIEPRSAFQPNGIGRSPGGEQPRGARRLGHARPCAPRLPGSCTSHATTTSAGGPNARLCRRFRPIGQRDNAAGRSDRAGGRYHGGGCRLTSTRSASSRSDERPDFRPCRARQSTPALLVRGWATAERVGDEVRPVEQHRARRRRARPHDSAPRRGV